jgi:hypothetical protein
VAQDGDEIVSVAMNLNIRDGYEVWFDTVKERIMKIEEIITNEQDKFSFKRKLEGDKVEVYTFVPMTLEIYNSRVKQGLLAPRDFDNLDDLIKAFEETRKNAW